MTGSLNILATNQITEKFSSQSFKNSSLCFEDGIHTLFLNNKKYILDIKKTFFLDEKIIIEGIISDDEFSVGRIAFEFFPENP
jgi:hypothetical protein